MAGHQAGGPVPVRCLACGRQLAELVQPRAAVALRHTGLEASVSAVVVCCDDLPDADDGWLRLDPGGGPDVRPVLTVFCSPRVFRDESRDSVEPRPAVWEQGLVPSADDDGGEALPFSPARTNAFLHHQFMLAADLLGGRLQPDLVPAGQAEAFAAAWDVVLDGRLERLGLPGYGQAWRRGRFSRLFSAAGVLMPGHWQVFQALWDGAIEATGEVLGAVRQLPRL